MRNFLAALCVASLLFSSVAMAGGLSRRLASEGSRLGQLIVKAKQVGASLAVAAMLTCGTTGCNTKDEAAHAVADRRVATLNYEHDASIDEAIAQLEQTEGAQIGIVTGVDSQGMVTLETDGGTVSLQLLGGEALINGGKSPLKVALFEEVVDEGIISEGSRLAIIPGYLVAGGLLVFSGVVTLASMFNFGGGEDISKLETVTTVGIGLLASATMGVGTYHLLVML